VILTYFAKMEKARLGMGGFERKFQDTFQKSLFH